ncbi:FIST signal transduction protein [Ideonella sp. BN130291]|uniref:FIST signal transduction protein n=1 Tax=Ideonella sp. BN130291 TaxID=3112940 RepID=UPI002E265F47|nr:FIST N-terminal domain-containing protein [Ideonella sp. BN130291]
MRASRSCPSLPSIVNQTYTALSTDRDSQRAGARLASDIRAAFGGASPHAVIVFASSSHDCGRLLQALRQGVGNDAILTGASSAGEFTHGEQTEGAVSALALRSSSLQFALGVGRNVQASPAQAARDVVSGFRGMAAGALPYRAAMVMTDALAGYADEVVDGLTLATGGGYSFFGGGAGDDGHFKQTHVFAGTEVLGNAVVALEILSPSPIGVGVAHGWDPVGDGYRVTEADGVRVVSLNGMPAADVIAQYAEATGQLFDRADPLPFFLHNILGIHSPSGYRLRVPLGVDADGTLLCAAAVPRGAVVHLMKTSAESAVSAARQATQHALQALQGGRPAVGLVFDCVATRLRLGHAFRNELDACAELLQPAQFVGCNTYGQIARAEGQFGGFHNCTAVVCVLPQA